MERVEKDMGGLGAALRVTEVTYFFLIKELRGEELA